MTAPSIGGVINGILERIYAVEQLVSNPTAIGSGGGGGVTDPLTIGTINVTNLNINGHTLLGTVPGTVTDITVNPEGFLNNIYVDMDWTSSDPQPSTWYVFIAKKNLDTSYQTASMYSTQVSELRVMGLDAHTTYGYRIIGVSAMGVSGDPYPETGWVDFTTGADSTIPSALTYIGVNLAKIQLSSDTPSANDRVVGNVQWSESDDPDVANGNGLYELQFDSVDTFNSGLLKAYRTAGTIIGIDEPLSSWPAGFVRIRAIDASGNPSPWYTDVTDWGDGLAVTGSNGLTPDKVTGLQVVPSVAGFYLSWTRPVGTAITEKVNYDIYVWDGSPSDSEWIPITVLDPTETFVTRTNNTNVIVSNKYGTSQQNTFIPGDTYFFIVVPTNDVGQSTVQPSIVYADFLGVTDDTLVTIDGSRLIAGTVTASAIAAGTITADKIQAGTIEITVQNTFSDLPMLNRLQYTNLNVESADFVNTPDGYEFSNITLSTTDVVTGPGGYTSITAAPVTGTDSSAYLDGTTDTGVLPNTKYKFEIEFSLDWGPDGMDPVDDFFNYTANEIVFGLTPTGGDVTFSSLLIKSQIGDLDNSSAGSIFGNHFVDVKVAPFINDTNIYVLTCQVLTDDTITSINPHITLTGSNFDGDATPPHGTLKLYSIKFARVIEAGNIAEGAVTSTTIAPGAITTGKIAAEAITADNIAAHAITAAQIATSGLSASSITVGVMSGDRIDVNTLDAAAIKTSTLEAATITLGTDGRIVVGTPPTNGIYFDETGIAAWKASVLTFQIEADGSASFSGTLTAADMIGGTITGAVIDGGVLLGGSLATPKPVAADPSAYPANVVIDQYGFHQYERGIRNFCGIHCEPRPTALGGTVPVGLISVSNATAKWATSSWFPTSVGALEVKATAIGGSVIYDLLPGATQSFGEDIAILSFEITGDIGPDYEDPSYSGPALTSNAFDLSLLKLLDSSGAVIHTGVEYYYGMVDQTLDETPTAVPFPTGEFFLAPTISNGVQIVRFFMVLPKNWSYPIEKSTLRLQLPAPYGYNIDDSTNTKRVGSRYWASNFQLETFPGDWTNDWTDAPAPTTPSRYFGSIDVGSVSSTVYASTGNLGSGARKASSMLTIGDRAVHIASATVDVLQVGKLSVNKQTLGLGEVENLIDFNSVKAMTTGMYCGFSGFCANLPDSTTDWMLSTSSYLTNTSKGVVKVGVQTAYEFNDNTGLGNRTYQRRFYNDGSDEQAFSPWISPLGQAVAISDWNAAFDTGFYVGSLNSPTGGSFWGTAIKTAPGVTFQVVHRHSSGSDMTLAYERVYSSGAWGDWVQVGGQPTFHYVGESGEPAFQNGFTNYNTTPGYEVCGFAKDANSFVHLEGLVKNATTNKTGTIFFLPVGYRPRGTHIVLAAASNSGTPGVARVDIGANGSIGLTAYSTSSATYISLSTIAPFLAYG